MCFELLHHFVSVDAVVDQKVGMETFAGTHSVFFVLNFLAIIRRLHCLWSEIPDRTKHHCTEQHGRDIVNLLNCWSRVVPMWMHRANMYVRWVDSCGELQSRWWLLTTWQFDATLCLNDSFSLCLLINPTVDWTKELTPLHYAADVVRDFREETRTRKVRVFSILCQNGADPFLKDIVCTIISFRTVFIQLSFSQFSF